MKISRKKRQLLIALIDIILLIAAIYLALLIRDWKIPSSHRFQRHFGYFIPIIAAWVISLYTAGLYSLEVPYTGYRALSRIALCALLCLLIGFAFFYLNLQARVVPKTILAIYSTVAFFLLAVWRWIFNKVTLTYFSSTDIAFAGINDSVIDVLNNSHNFSYMSYTARFFYDENYPEDRFCNVPVIRDPAVFVSNIKEYKIQTVVILNEKNISSSIQTILFDLLQHHITFISLPDFYELYLRRIPVGAINELWFLKSIDFNAKNIYQFIKRLGDIFLALCLLTVSLPFWPFIMLIIKLESPGPVFFKQTRTGYLGRQFGIVKFRTMSVADNTHEPTKRNDLRVTVFGRFLRRTRIDEIPQFFNILKGEMSFIGPRPERPELIAELEQEIPFYRQRLLVKPGVSGWDQVSGEYHSPSKGDTYKKLQYDLYYIKNVSFFLDVSIFFKTLVIVCVQAGV
ncbi:sugar transferase [Treponema primitia]|uniref:sugar transferase n=1 Tax=Treponema primitia TaxID=88058 RepID=UPI0002554ED6|nr:sugar transferase [Treponema primitia]